MTTHLDVAVIGAGPYGLSIGAHLEAAGIDYCVFGTPMDCWQHHMPAGMHLKSYGDSSNLFDPQSSYTLEQYSQENGLAYHHTNLPVKLERFVEYGQAFQRRLAPRLAPRQLIALDANSNRHELTFDNGECVLARHVILAIGVVPFRYLPPALSQLPGELASHSCDYGPLARFKGKRVSVIGTGSSALDMAALLSMQGAAVTLIGRSSSVGFQSAPYIGPAQTKSLPFLRRLLSPPATGLGKGWLLHLCADLPEVVHCLPDSMRGLILDKVLGPLGGYSIRQEITQNVSLKLGRSVERVEEAHGRVRLSTVSHDGARESIESDHVIAATGYQIDLRRLSFLQPTSLDKLRMAHHAPVLTSNFESSVRGLYFVGLASARSFGPVMRFVVGAVYPAKKLARMFRSTPYRSITSVPAAISE